jgi:hypothetical protein
MSKWDKITDVSVKRFLSEDEDEIMYVIKTGFLDKYVAVFEDANELTLAKTVTGNKHYIETKFNIEFKGVLYLIDISYWKESSVNDSADFQFLQLKHCIEVKDFVTLENRITNMLLHGGLIKK